MTMNNDTLAERRERINALVEEFSYPAAWADGDEGYALIWVDAKGGVWCAIVTIDPHPDAPYFDGGDPVFEIGTGISSPEGLMGPVYGNEDESGVDIHDAWDRMYRLVQSGVTGWENTVDLVDRWLRIFHGGSATTISSTAHPDAPDYLVFDTRKMREARGMTGIALERSAPSAEEWEAYLDDEVYSVELQRLVDPNVKRRKALAEEFAGVLLRGRYGPTYSLSLVAELVGAAELAVGHEPLVWESEDGPIYGFYGLEHARAEAAASLAHRLVAIEGEEE